MTTQYTPGGPRSGHSQNVGASQKMMTTPLNKMESPSSEFSASEYDRSGHTDTSLIFSPADNAYIPKKPRKSYAREEESNDPFSSAAPRSTLTLNATATDFTPSTTMLSALPPKMAKPATTAGGQDFGAQYLQNHIKNDTLPPVGPHMSSGTFTRDLKAERVLKFVLNAKGPPGASLLKHLATTDFKIEALVTLYERDQTVYIHCADLRTARGLHDTLLIAGLGSIDYFEPLALAELFPKLAAHMTKHEGQMVLRIQHPDNARSSVGRMQLEADIRQEAMLCGTVCAYATLPVEADDHICMMIEYFDSGRVPVACQSLNGRKFSGKILYAKAYHPDTETDPYAHLAGLSPLSGAGGSVSYATLPESSNTASQLAPAAPMGLHHMNNVGMAAPFANQAYGSNVMPPPQGPLYAYAHPSFGVGQSALGMGALGQNPMVPYNVGGQMIMMAPMPFQQFALPMGYAMDAGRYGSPGHRGGYHGGYGRARGGGRFAEGGRFSEGGRWADNNSFRPARQLSEIDHKKPENVVQMDRIQHGLDVRTTIMLRNIPNKMTQAQLLKIIKDVSVGKFDFMYLRIDFSNDCNVGYAFINYIDPIDIVAIVDALAGNRWPDEFRSDKVAEISYATIQGRDCLIQKFRNSSVMLEKPECRPKLFYTEGHPLSGEEEEFPASDNQSKLKRSCENAEHVGLFAPAVGQQHRADQRSRASQWDRGTTLSARERPFGSGFGRDNRHGFSGFPRAHEDEEYPGFEGQYPGY